MIHSSYILYRLSLTLSFLFFLTNFSITNRDMANSFTLPIVFYSISNYLFHLSFEFLSFFLPFIDPKTSHSIFCALHHTKAENNKKRKSILCSSSKLFMKFMQIQYQISISNKLPHQVSFRCLLGTLAFCSTLFFKSNELKWEQNRKLMFDCLLVKIYFLQCFKITVKWHLAVVEESKKLKTVESQSSKALSLERLSISFKLSTKIRSRLIDVDVIFRENDMRLWFIRTIKKWDMQRWRNVGKKESWLRQNR